ncbi:hypothetical protein H180DRAFT_00432 [Streptomyces sp. WMMB 322]|nr:hypothetical protein H180DRAFT_00432 [Streptomyces sp. WMMB 322]
MVVGGVRCRATPSGLTPCAYTRPNSSMATSNKCRDSDEERSRGTPESDRAVTMP